MSSIFDSHIPYRPKRNPGGPLGPRYVGQRNEGGVYTTSKELHPRAIQEPDQELREFRVLIREVEESREPEDSDFQPPLPDPRRSAEIYNSEPMQVIPARNGTAEWRKPGTRFEPPRRNK